MPANRTPHSTSSPDSHTVDPSSPVIPLPALDHGDFDILSFLTNDAQLLSETVNDAPPNRPVGETASLETYIDRGLALRMLALYFNHVCASGETR